jgi:hypothetical protein
MLNLFHFMHFATHCLMLAKSRHASVIREHLQGGGGYKILTEALQFLSMNKTFKM